MIDGSEKRNRQLAFELENSRVCEKRSKIFQLYRILSSKIEISRLTFKLRRHVQDTFASCFLSASFTFLNRVFQLLHTLPLLPFLDCMVSCEFSPTREALENESIELPCVKSRTFINISTLKRCFKNKLFIRITSFHVKVPYY